MSVLVGALLLLMTARAPQSSAEHADLVLLSAKIWTADAARPQATALAARDGRIFAVGSDAEIGRLRGPETVVLDAKGRRVVPGFIDSHTHTYTSTAAHAGFAEKDKGSLAVGKLADFVVLSRDVLSIPSGEILDARVDATVVGGRIVYSR